jgi:hypothetical protein
MYVHEEEELSEVMKEIEAYFNSIKGLSQLTEEDLIVLRYIIRKYIS